MDPNMEHIQIFFKLIGDSSRLKILSSIGTVEKTVDRKSTRLNSSHGYISYALFFFNDAATTEIYPLSLHDALPISHTDLLQAHWRLESAEDPLEHRNGREDCRSEEHTSELQSRLHLLCPLFF